MDVDIDLRSDFDVQEIFPDAVRASRVNNKELKPHNVGAYLQHIPVDKITGLSAIPYNEAEEMGYFKIDFLHLYILDYFKSKQEIKLLLQKEPSWDLFQDPDIISKLFQLKNHVEFVYQVKPQSIHDIADCIALIRPAKKYLQGAYLKSKTTEQKRNIRKFLYAKPDGNQIYFKKSHAVAYAHNIVLQLHLIEAEIL